MTDSPVSEELLALEHAGWRSLCDGTGDRFYGDVMTDDALMVLANGAVMDRATVVSALGQSPPWARYAIDDVQMITIAVGTMTINNKVFHAASSSALSKATCV